MHVFALKVCPEGNTVPARRKRFIVGTNSLAFLCPRSVFFHEGNSFGIHTVAKRQEQGASLCLHVWYARFWGGSHEAK